MKEYCVYMLTSPSGKSYIGQTGNLKQRISQHRCGDLRRSSYIINTIKDYGFDNFTICILQDGLDLQGAQCWEEFYVDSLATIFPHGYNSVPGGKAPSVPKEIVKKTTVKLAGQKRSPEIRRKMSEAQRARTDSRKLPPFTEEHRRKMALEKTGHKQSAETIEKRVSKLRGLKRPQHVIDAIILAHTGKTVSENTRLKMSIAQKKRFAKEK